MSSGTGFTKDENVAISSTLSAISSTLSSVDTNIAELLERVVPRIDTGDTAPTEIAISDGASTQSAALTAGFYLITADIDVAFLVATNPTATSASRKLWAGTGRIIEIATANDKVAAIRLNSNETGTVSIEPYPTS